MKLHHVIKSCLVGLSLMLCAMLAMADNNSPVGYWKTMEGGQPSSIVQITQNNKTLQGKVVKLYTNPDAKCVNCTGDMHNKAIMGSTVLWGFNQLQNGGWSKGKLLAVRRGKVFDADMALSKDGQKLLLDVDAMGGHHQKVWQRVQDQNG